MEFINIRGGLLFTERAIVSGELRIGYLGGSITENKVPHNWTEPFMFGLMERYPKLKIVSENAAIGATGSDLGIIHVDSHILPKHCDLVFIEYAVNDWWTPSEERACALEGILRKLFAYGKCDVILVYTFCQEMYPYLAKGELPLIVREYEEIAKYYHISSAYMGAFAFDLNKKGFLKWEEWLPDGLHPQFRGSLEYATCVKKLVFALLDGKNDDRIRADAVPMRAENWEKASVLPFEKVEYRPPFYVRRTATQAYVPYVLTTNAVGAELTLNVECKTLYLFFDFGRNSCEFEYAIDGKPSGISKRDRPDWCGTSGWLRPYKIDCGMRGKHTVTLKVCHPNVQGYGTSFELAYILQV